jgi:hypothetical protein
LHRRDVARAPLGLYGHENAAWRLMQDRFAYRAIQPARKRTLIPMTNDDQIRIYLSCGQNYLFRWLAVLEFARCCASSTS